jgi:putative iron-only hydrogenase system regulator
MEKRIGAAIILVEKKESVEEINTILTHHSALILGRQGMPLRDKGISIINLILEASPEEISSLTGKIGRLEGVQVKSVLTRYQ